MASNVPPLKEDLWDIFQIGGEGLQFLSSQTGIYDVDELKKHVLVIQAKAYQIMAYPCIRMFNFTRLKISVLPAYSRIMSLLRERPDAILLDLLGFGTDIRKAAADGFPIQNLVACDLHREFWNFGHELFRSTPETFPVAFLEGDVFDRTPICATLPPSLSTITSLTALNGHVSIVQASSFFHLFDEQMQTELARSIAGLLSPLPGSMALGSQMGKTTAGYYRRPAFHPGDCEMGFAHSIERCCPEETRRVASVHDIAILPPTPEGDDGRLVWSITRL
ncbi:hypothetical protein GGX14DRAFT_537152 [Mycena pura]|uniref:Uncharacterized protein n=1 Tax=Mycena pura TaxID=153505 RepID=A0AAD6V069_9AGAR|nr:hypothetical protein GGX14DRAFT_537152 [Mycena pura]